MAKSSKNLGGKGVSKSKAPMGKASSGRFGAATGKLLKGPAPGRGKAKFGPRPSGGGK